MDAVTGINALKRTIELILQKLNMVQDEMNELSREELIEIMGNNDLDLSWIASQESVNELRKELLSAIKDMNDRMLNPFVGLTVGYLSELNQFRHDIINDDIVITGKSASQSCTDMSVKEAYVGSDNKCHKTTIKTSIPIIGDQVVTVNVDKCVLFEGSSIVEAFSKVNCGLREFKMVDNISSSTVTTLFGMFDGCYNLQSVIITDCDFSNITDMRLLSGTLSSLNVKSMELSRNTFGNVTSIDGVFTKSLTDINLSNVKFPSLTSMDGMFNGCANLTKLDMSGVDTSNIQSMQQMFFGCSNITSLDLTSFDTRNVTNMTQMFAKCTNLKEILVSRDKFVIPTQAAAMFKDCGVDHVTYVD